MARKPKLFFVSKSATTSKGAVQLSTFKREVDGESMQLDKASSKVSGNREGKFLHYWITTTTTSTSFTNTLTVTFGQETGSFNSKQGAMENVQSSREDWSLDREGRFLHYWATSTSFFTSTPSTITISVYQWHHLQIVSELHPVFI